MAVRLVKVAKELNVGTSTIVTFLNENGFEVDNKPTAKISDEMYAVLVENFKNSIAIKEKANKITIGSSPAKPNDEDEPPLKETPVEEAPKAETKKKESPKVEPTQKAELSGPKVIGKIDLEGLGKKKKKEAEAEASSDDKPEDTSIEEPEESVEPTENEPDIQVDAPQLKGLKILGKINIETKKKKKKETSTDTESGDDEPKRKRRRRKIVSNQINSSGADTGEEISDYKQKASSGKQYKSPDKEPLGGRNKKKGRKKSIDEKEIGQKLKETMSLLDGGGKKKKKYGTSRKERDEKREELLKEQENAEDEVAKIEVTEFISVAELAGMMNISSTDIIMACMREKRMVSINQRLDRDLIELMCIEFGYEVEFVSAEDQMEKDYQIEEDDLEDTENRSPIVTVMGHVDHGKTSLLDSIRKSNIADSEAGGITQHIGAYMVKVENGGSITFLDTPGHEAFTAMRARGAKVTDIAIIIISADDCIMPQTKEAISHAKAADVPIVFAINKIDKDGANPDKIKQELASMDLLIEEWGGTYQSQDVSAKQGLNIDALLEKVLLEAELLELKANAEKRAVGTVLEASLEQGRGYVAKVLVRNGTLKVGDSMIAGPYHGKVKAMFDERNKRLKVAGPSTPVLVLGLQGAPQAGETLNVMSSEKETKELASKRANLLRQQQIRSTRRVTLDDITNRIKIGNFKELNLIIKGDFDGSVEALSDSLLKLSTDQVQTNVIYKAVGPVTESDVNLAAASDAIIVGFQVRPNPMARRLAEKEGVEIKSYSIIYDAIDEIKSALEGMLEPKQVEEITGMVEIQEVFKISKVGAVAGCFVQEGKVTRNSYIRIIREGIVEYPKKEGVHGELSSLKRFKDAVQEVKQGFECGLTIKNYNDIKQGDVIEVYTINEVKQSL